MKLVLPLHHILWEQYFKNLCLFFKTFLLSLFWRLSPIHRRHSGFSSNCWHPYQRYFLFFSFKVRWWTCWENSLDDPMIPKWEYRNIFLTFAYLSTSSQLACAAASHCKGLGWNEKWRMPKETACTHLILTYEWAT